MHIAVFGDLHGNILLAFQCCARWQQKTGQQLDLILQVGDLGVFPDRTRLDRATRRHSERNPVVFSFQDFFTAEHPEVTTLLEELRCPLLFVRGNHEDHSWLDACEHQLPNPCFPVDAYLRLWCVWFSAIDNQRGTLHRGIHQMLLLAQPCKHRLFSAAAIMQ